MRPIRRLSFYGVRTNEQWIESCIEGVIGESKFTRQIKKFTRQIKSMCPTFFNLAIAGRALDIATKGLRSAGLLKRHYYKHDKKYWK
jgi:hypothetical protein